MHIVICKRKGGKTLNKKQMNIAVLDYQKSKCEKTFHEIYDHFITRIDKLFVTIGKSIGADYWETRALYEDTLLKCISNYDGSNDFENLFNASIPLQRRHFLRGRSNRNKHEFIPKKDDMNAATFEVTYEITPEDAVVTKKEADQRQLIDFLLDKAKDATTTAIVEAFLSSERPTPTAIGKQLGLHHSTVIRKIEKLASKFDNKQFGDFRDYLVAN